MTLKRQYIIVLSLAAFALPALEALSVDLVPGFASPASVGTVVSWRANVTGDDGATLWYRFRARRSGSDFRIIRDFSPENTLDWAPIDYEGNYEIELSVRDVDTGEEATTIANYRLDPAATTEPIVRETLHPLVLLYSAPPCPSGSRMRVNFESDLGDSGRTPAKACADGLSMNFYLAGLRASTKYRRSSRPNSRVRSR